MAANALLLLAVSLAWAAGYVFVGAVDQGAPPITATAAMCLLAAAAMLPAVALTPGRTLLQPLRKRPWVPLAMGLTAVALPNLAVVAAERAVPPAQSAVLGTTVPIVTLLLGALIGSRIGSRLGSRVAQTTRLTLPVSSASRSPSPASSSSPAETSSRKTSPSSTRSW